MGHVRTHSYQLQVAIWRVVVQSCAKIGVISISSRRICVGIAMAERMMMYSLATLLHSFDWKLPQGEKLDHTEKFGIVLKKKKKKKIPLVAVPTLGLCDPSTYE